MGPPSGKATEDITLRKPWKVIAQIMTYQSFSIVVEIEQNSCESLALRLHERLVSDSYGS